MSATPIVPFDVAVERLRRERLLREAVQHQLAVKNTTANPNPGRSGGYGLGHPLRQTFIFQRWMEWAA